MTLAPQNGEPPKQYVHRYGQLYRKSSIPWEKVIVIVVLLGMGIMAFISRVF